jgi:hypothetical protein
MQAKIAVIMIAITAPIEHHGLQIDSFGKAVGLASNKVIENLLPLIA